MIASVPWGSWPGATARWGTGRSSFGEARVRRGQGPTEAIWPPGAIVSTCSPADLGLGGEVSTNETSPRSRRASYTRRPPADQRCSSRPACWNGAPPPRTSRAWSTWGEGRRGEHEARRRTARPGGIVERAQRCRSAVRRAAWRSASPGRWRCGRPGAALDEATAGELDPPPPRYWISPREL